MLFFSSNFDIVNTKKSNKYFERFYELLKFWESDEEKFEFITSGSTGTPKNIEVTKTQIKASIECTRSTFNLTENDLLFCCLNLNYIAGAMMAFRAIHLKTDLIVVEPSSNPFKEIKKQAYLLENKRIFFAFVPLQIEQIISDPESIALLKRAKAILIGGAAINNKIEDFCVSSPLPFYTTYGMTETLSHVAIRKLNAKSPYFEALNGVEIAINQENCLKIKAEVTLQNWIQTNDVVEIIDTNKFVLKGRKDLVINSGGVKIHPEIIEKKISNALNLSQRFFCSGLPDDKLGQKLILVIENDSNILKKEDFEGILGNFEIPKEIFHLPKFYETGSGKIDKLKIVDELLNNKIPNF
jgi:o-succinylbenzoate---CoA ligase